MSHVFLSMIPPTITDQMHRVGVSKTGKPFFYRSAELEEARSELRARLAKFSPKEPLTGAVALRVLWCFPIKGKHIDGEWKTSKPDTDNLQKMLKDVMTDLNWWADDAQVAMEVVEKHWAEKPGIFIEWRAI